MKNSPLAPRRTSRRATLGSSQPWGEQVGSSSARWRLLVAIVVAVVALVANALAVTAASTASAFADETHAAMNRMMSAMGIRPTGDVDRDFAAMMIPHHQGAIDMAKAELRHGTSEPLRRLAQEIVVEQQQEIAVMRLALDQPATSTARTAR